MKFLPAQYTPRFVFGLTLAICFLFSGALRSQTCECRDKVYLNDEIEDVVHKFDLDPATGQATEIGSPWFGPVADLNPHGIGADLNGNVFFGQANSFGGTGVNGPVYKTNCEGELETSDFLGSVNGIHFNFAAKEGALYIPDNANGTIRAFRICDGELIGTLDITDNPPSFGASWGFSIDETSWYFASREGNGEIYTGTLDTTLYVPGQAGSAAFSTGLSGNFQALAPMGVTRDADGNFFVVFNQLSGDQPVPEIRKYDPDGNLLLTVTDGDNTTNAGDGAAGFWGARGIVYSETTGLLYVSARANCLTVFDTDLVEQSALNIGNPTGGRAKGIGIITECCPTSMMTVIDTTICLEQFGTSFQLRDLLSCSGAICEGEFTEVSSDADISLDPCTNNIQVDGQGSASYRLEAAPAGPNAFCGDFSIELNLSFTAPPMISATPTCTLDGANVPSFTITVPVTSSAILAGEDVFLDVNGTEVAADVLDAAGSFTFTDVPTGETPGANNIIAVRIGNSVTCAASVPVDFLSCAPGCMDGPGEIGGTAFSDINNDGANAGAADVGLPNVEVNVYDCNDMLVCQTATNSNGEWSCTGLMDGDQYRVEYAAPAGSDFQPSRAGADNGTATQIVTSPLCGVDFGLLTSEACPPAEIESHALGDLSSMGTLLSSGLAILTCGAIVDPMFPPSMQYTLGAIDIRNVGFGDNRPTGTLIDFHHPDWIVSQIGNVFGTAVDDTGAFYTTASSHYGSSFGYSGSGGRNFRKSIINYGAIGGGENSAAAAGTIYVLDRVTGAPSVWAQLPQQLSTFQHIGCENSADDFMRTAGVGLGNIDFDQANRQFFVSNFEDGMIYRLDMDGNILDSFDPQTLPGFRPDDGTPGFANDFKPYGLETAPDGSRLYFGAHVVDDDPNTSLEVAGIYFVDLAEDGSFDGTENFLVNVVPDPATGRPNDFNAFGRNPGWVSASDLEFNPDGDLMIGLRTGCGVNSLPVFASSHNHGATYAIYKFDDGSLFNVETRYRGDVPNTGTGNDDVYGGIGIWDKKNGDYTYAVSSSDIVSELGPHGIMLFPDDFTQSGTSRNDFILKPSAALPYFSNLTSNDFKGVGGDIDVFSPCGPIVPEIGNYAWIDEDGDGVQDPCEPPLADLIVNLYSQPDDGSAPVLLATTTTDADGQYYFSSADNDGARVNWLTAEDMIIAGNNYTVAFTSADGINPNNGVLTVDGMTYEITMPDATANNGNDQNDSDVSLQVIDGSPFAAYSTQAGEVDNINHTFDAGFVPVIYDLALRKILGDNGTAVAFNPGDNVVFDIEVVNQGTATTFDIVVGDQLPAGLSFVSVNGPALTTEGGVPTGLTTGSTTGPVLDFTLDSLPAGDSVIISLTLMIDDPYTGTFPIVNTAEIQAFDSDMDAATPAPDDVDSTPDTDFMNDPGGGIDNPANDVVSGDGNGFPNDGNAAGDEDDADSEPVPYYDVALTKVIDAASLGANGLADEDELLDFTITVVNQGNLPVSDVVVFDDIPCGFDFVGAGGGTAPVNADFSGDNSGATATIAGPIPPGGTATVTIQLRLRGTGELDAACMADAMRFVNKAEIASIDPDGAGGDPPLEMDFDSNFDEGDDAEDGGGMANGNTDNVVDGNGTGVAGSDDPATDDDDQDPAGTQVVDIALAKVIDEMGSGDGSGPPYRIGDLIKFDIQLTNQGTQPLTNIDVVDVLPNGLEYEATAGDAGWAYDAGTRTATTTFTGTLTSASPMATISIFARVVAPTGDPMEDYLNVAEVAEIDAMVTDFSDPNLGTITRTLNQDADSPLNGDVTDNTGGVAGSPDDDNINGGGPSRNEDQDNADPALVDVALLSLGSTVFLDNENDGVQNGTDAGIPMVEVQLFDATTGDQVLTTADGVVTTDPAAAAPVFTDMDGNYLFSNLQPGDYFVTLPTAPAAAPVSSNATSSGFMETDPDDDEDSDDDGLQAGGSGTAITSGVITLEPLNEPENEPGQGGSQDTTLADGFLDANGNMTLDFGVFAPVSIGDRLFIDLDGDGLRGPGDPGLEGATITIFDLATMMPVTLAADGSPYDPRTTTDENGDFNFDNLPPGNYYLRVDVSTAPNSEFYDFTIPNAGNDGLDSDVSPRTPGDDVADSNPSGFLLSGTMLNGFTAGVACAIEVVGLEPFTVCSTEPIVLDSVATIVPSSLDGVWTTDGDGTFLEDGGFPVFAPFTTDIVASYLAGPGDARRGEVTLTLTTDDPADATPPSVCAPVSNSVTIQILKVDCGDFFWDGDQ